MPAGWDGRGLRVHTDTTDFFAIDYGDVVLLGGRPYLVRNNAREGRFGLDDDVKYWVKRSIDLDRGEMCIIKLVFYEKFKTSVGGIEFECFRSPRKEARILQMVRNHPNFMHGESVVDEKGNTIRILDYIKGKSLSGHIADLDQDHESYFYDIFPDIFHNFIECVDAIRHLHENGEKHGDIRRDHILLDRETGKYRWIDFDYNFRHRENIYGYDLFGLGNILVYIVGKGDMLLYHLKRQHPDAFSGLRETDVNIVFHNRVANLKKIYSYIPDSLNRVLLHFSTGANWFYEHTEQLLQDLQQAAGDIHK
ncbi:MAG: serine/threonine-protein kinase [Desulfobacterales bacterium]